MQEVHERFGCLKKLFGVMREVRYNWKYLIQKLGGNYGKISSF